MSTIVGIEEVDGPGASSSVLFLLRTTDRAIWVNNADVSKQQQQHEKESEPVSSSSVVAGGGAVLGALFWETSVDGACFLLWEAEGVLPSLSSSVFFFFLTFSMSVSLFKANWTSSFAALASVTSTVALKRALAWAVDRRMRVSRERAVMGSVYVKGKRRRRRRRKKKETVRT